MGSVECCNYVGRNVLAVAASPHCVKGPTATAQVNSLVVSRKAAGLVVSWKAAGLGNTITQMGFPLTGTAMSQCFTKSGNPVNGVPKSEATNVNATGTFPMRNGQTTGSFTSFDLIRTGGDVPPVHLTSP